MFASDLKDMISLSSVYIYQVAYGLAVSEAALEFEHRDLHWGNVLVAPASNAMLEYTVEGEEVQLSTQVIVFTSYVNCIVVEIVPLRVCVSV